jgi:tetratricopeptide (TPR) repeat protein
MDTFVKVLLYATLSGVHLMVLFVMVRGFKVRRLEGVYHRALKSKEYDKALTAINTALDMQPQSPELYQYRARLYIALDDYTAAEADCTRSLTFYQAASAYLDRAQVRLSLDKAKEALIDANHAIACSRYWWKAYFMRAKTYAALGHRNVALNDLEQALECGADQPEVKQLYSQLQQKV